MSGIGKGKCKCIGRKLGAVICFALVCTACSSNTKPQPRVEYYTPAFRQIAPEPVYSRLTWSQVPQPISEKARDIAPLIDPVLSFELPHSTLREALEALSQALGYRAQYPKGMEHRAISLKVVGTAEEILGKIEKQAHVKTVLNHQQRLIQVVDERTVPRL